MDLTDEQWKAKFDEVVAVVKKQPSAGDVAPQDIGPEALAGYIDHTVLKLDATEADVDKMCEEAMKYKFAAVCVREPFVARSTTTLFSTPIPVACVISFHEGTASTTAKLTELSRAIAAGALELDVVLNRTLLKSGSYRAVFAELHAIRAATQHPVELKLILETSELTEKEVLAATVLAMIAGWEYVKTSTGFCGRGASAQDVLLMKAVGEAMGGIKVKASGGIRSYDDAVGMIAVGADRVGASAGVKIVEEARARAEGRSSS